MKKVFLAVLVVLALAGSFLAGASLGARDAIENQIVSKKKASTKSNITGNYIAIGLKNRETEEEGKKWIIMCR